jgi:hypothetical protein
MIGCGGWKVLSWAREDGDLEARDLEALDAHLLECADCQKERERIVRVREALAAAQGEEPPGPHVLERAQAWLASRRRSPEVPREDSRIRPAEVLTPEDLADILAVSVDEIYAALADLPAFEFAGRIRFRRSAVESWMAEQEERWRRQSLASLLRLKGGPA